MDVRLGSPAAASPVDTGHIKRKMSLADFLNLDKAPHVDEALTSDAVLDSFDPAVRACRPDPREFFRGYKGKITPDWTGPQYVLIRDVTDKILFSQRTVSDFNPGEKCDFPLDYLADALFVEFKRNIDRSGDGALDVVAMGEGMFTSLDNRRLLIAKKIGAVDRTFGIWIKVHGYNDPLSPGLQRRFGGARTWGEAVQLRINHRTASGYPSNPTIMTTNAENRRVEAESQTISLSMQGMDLSALHLDDVLEINRRKVNGSIKI